jgi:hypothetical protein
LLEKLRIVLAVLATGTQEINTGILLAAVRTSWSIE